MKLSSADYALARRLESTEAQNGAAFAKAGSNAAGEMFLGGCAIFGGVGSPMTHALGIGMQAEIDVVEFDRMEEFFTSRGAAPAIDLCPLAHERVQQLVMERRYRIVEFNNVLARRVTVDDAAIAAAANIAIVESDGATYDRWCRMVMRGFLHGAEVTDDMVATMSGTGEVSDCFFAQIEGTDAGGPAMGVRDGVAALYGDSTLPESRGAGVQTELIRHRLAVAAARGCDLAMASVIPGSQSHRNYERAGFELIYMRVNVVRD